MIEAKHIPGPWRVTPSGLSVDGGKPDPNGGWPHGRRVANTDSKLPPATRQATARLIASAPDHALIARFLAVGLLRWEPFGEHGAAGELCFAGLRHATRLDGFGVPELTPQLRAALSAES